MRDGTNGGTLGHPRANFKPALQLLLHRSACGLYDSYANLEKDFHVLDSEEHLMDLY